MSEQARAARPLLDKIAAIKPLNDFYDHSYVSLRDHYFFHTVGKAANSTVKHVFYTMELEERGRPLPSVHDRAASPLMSPYQLDEERLQEVLTAKAFTRFTFVRNPYSRLLSCYLDRIADIKSRPHLQFVRAMGKPKRYRPTFAEFIETICKQDPVDQNNHWRVQYDDAMCALVDYDFIGKQENFAADMDAIVSRISGKQQDKVVGDVNASPSATSSSSKLPQYWTPALADRVQEAFAKDFDFFGYEREPEWLKALRSPPSPAPAPAKKAAPTGIAARGKPAAADKRAIRLKEFGTSVERKLVPSEAYLRHTNGTIEGDEFTLVTDANGFIVDPAYRDREGPRVLVYGDSFVECSFIAQGQRLTDRMNAAQDGRLVLNGGYSGSTTLHSLQSFLAKGVPLAPSHLVYVLPSNDVLSMMQNGGLWNFADQRYTPIIPSGTAAVAGSAAFERNAAALAPLLRALCAVTRDACIDLTLGTMPFIASDYREENWFRIRHNREADIYEGLADKRRHINGILREVAGDEGVRLLDIADMLPNDHFYDDVHMNARGCAKMADIMIEAIGLA